MSFAGRSHGKGSVSIAVFPQAAAAGGLWPPRQGRPKVVRGPVETEMSLAALAGGPRKLRADGAVQLWSASKGGRASAFDATEEIFDVFPYLVLHFRREPVYERLQVLGHGLSLVLWHLNTLCGRYRLNCRVWSLGAIFRCIFLASL